MSALKKKTRKNFLHDLGLRWRIFIYLLGFAIVMVVLLWFFQIVYLDDFYEKIKKDQIEAAYNNIVQNIDSENLQNYIEQVAFHYNLCASIYLVKSDNGLVFDIQEIVKVDILADCIIHHIDAIEINRLYREATAMPEGYMDIFSRVRFNVTRTDDGSLEGGILTKTEGLSKSLVYARMAEVTDSWSYMVLLNSSITPVAATVSTLRVQLVFISVILIAVALGLSFFIARRLSGPISKINEAAKRLGRGDFSGNFAAGCYREISELADTLNFASAELARTDMLQKELVANISHDIRTPLMMIAGYAEYMRDFPDEDHRDSIEVIMEETGRLRDLVNDILDSSRMSAGINIINPRVFDFTDALTSFVRNYNHLIEPQGYQIELTAQEDVWLNADEHRLMQAIGNILNNALTHIGDDKRIKVRQTVYGRTMRLEISDQGCGIAAEDIPHIWERYYRTSAPGKGSQSSGLGLAIVKGILDLHKAKYGVISAPGHGSTFWFELNIYTDIKEEH